jgi:hypothetical protein
MESPGLSLGLMTDLELRRLSVEDTSTIRSQFLKLSVAIVPSEFTLNYRNRPWF